MPKADFAKLSELIKPLDVKMQVKYIKQFRDAAKEGELDCMPIEKTFEVRGSTYRDLVTQQDEKFTKWHAETLRNLELTTKRGAAGIAYEEDVLSGKVDFKARAEEFRKSLKKKKRRGSKKMTPGEAVVDTDKASAKLPKAQAAAALAGDEKQNDQSGAAAS